MSVDHLLDDRLVLGRDRGVAVTCKRCLDEAEIRCVDVRLDRIRKLRRLEVRALHKPQVGAQREQGRQIGLGAVEVRLQHGADVLVARLTEAAVDPQGRLDQARLLHVDPNEVPELARPLDEALDVHVGQLLVELEAEMSELERDVDREPLGRDALQDLPVARDDGVGLDLAPDALAEQRRVRVKALRRQLLERRDTVVERLTGDDIARRRAASRAST